MWSRQGVNDGWRLKTCLRNLSHLQYASKEIPVSCADIKEYVNRNKSNIVSLQAAYLFVCLSIYQSQLLELWA